MDCADDSVAAAKLSAHDTGCANYSKKALHGLLIALLGNRRCGLNWIASVFSLLLLFGKKIENCLSDWFLGHAIAD